MSCGCTTGIETPATPPFPAFPPPVGDQSTPGGSIVVDPCAGVNPAPTVMTAFIVPALGAQGQLYSGCAYVWALPGTDILIPPFGRITVTAVQNNIISYINRTIIEGTTIGAGTQMAVASGWDFGPTMSGNAVDFLLGVVGGYPRLIAGDAGMLMQRVVDTDSVTRWKPIQPAVAGFKYYPLASETDFITSPSITSWTGNLPGMPGGNIPCVPVINAHYQLQCNTSIGISRNVHLNGFPLWSYSLYAQATHLYQSHGAAAVPGYALCMGGNPVNITVDELNEGVAGVVTEFRLSIAGWHY